MPLSPEGIGIIFILYLRPFTLCIAAVQDHAVVCTVYLDTILRIHLTKDIYNFISFIVQFYFCAKNHRCIAGYIKFIIVCSVVRCSQSSLECQYAAIFNDRCRNVIFHFQCSRFRRLVFHCNIAWYYCSFSGYRCCIRKPRCCDHRIFRNWWCWCFSFLQSFDRIFQCSCSCLNISITCLICNSFGCRKSFFKCFIRICSIVFFCFYLFCFCKSCRKSFACLGFCRCLCFFQTSFRILEICQQCFQLFCTCSFRRCFCCFVCFFERCPACTCIRSVCIASFINTFYAAVIYRFIQCFLSFCYFLFFFIQNLMDMEFACSGKTIASLFCNKFDISCINCVEFCGLFFCIRCPYTICYNLCPVIIFCFLDIQIIACDISVCSAGLSWNISQFVDLIFFSHIYGKGCRKCFYGW